MLTQPPWWFLKIYSVLTLDFQQEMAPSVGGDGSGPREIERWRPLAVENVYGPREISGALGGEDGGRTARGTCERIPGNRYGPRYLNNFCISRVLSHESFRNFTDLKEPQQF